MKHIKKTYKVQGHTKRKPESEEKYSEDLIRSYESAQSEWKMSADENEKFANGVQWTKKQMDILRARGQAPVSINAITWAIEQMKSMLTSNAPRFQATAMEDSDAKKAAVISLLMEYMWYISDGNNQLKIAIDDYAKLGRGALLAYVDPYSSSNDGDVKFISCDPRDVYPDPAAKDYLWRDAANILVVNYKTASQIATLYPEFSMKGAKPYEAERMNESEREATEGQIFSGEEKDYNESIYRIIDRYSKRKQAVHRVIDPFSGEEYEYDEKTLKAYRSKPAFAVDGKIKTASDETRKIEELLEEQTEQVEQLSEDTFVYTPGPQTTPNGEEYQPDPVMITRLSIGELIDRGAISVREIKKDRVYRIITIGEKKYWEGWLPTTHYPIIPVNNMWNRNPYPVSDVNHVRPVQELINKLNSLIIANAASATNQKVLLPRGSQDKTRLESELNKAGSTVIEFDAEIGQPVIFGAQAFPNALFNQIELYISMIERQFGIYALMDGNPAAAPQTFKGTMAIDEFGQRRIRGKKDDIETSINQLGKVMLDLARVVYTEERLIRMSQPNNEVTEAELNTMYYDETSQAVTKMNDITVGRYDVKVISGSTLPSNRFALMEYYLDLYERGLIDQVEVLKKAEIVDAEGVLNRAGFIQQLQAQIAELEEQVKNLRGNLQTAEREEIHAKKRLEVEKFKSELDGIRNNAQATAQIFAERQRQGSGEEN